MRSYPPTRLGDDADSHHGELVRDPYRWLESTTDPATAEWIAAQNRLTEAELAKDPE
jgi:prolyl oligopeptidase